MTTISRARTGCWTCRARRIKCDEVHPICRRCTRINAPCGYGIRLVWLEESLARGVCHGRSGVWSKRRDDEQNKNEDYPQRKASLRTTLLRQRERADDTDRRWMFLNTTMIDLEIHFNGVHSNRNYPEAFSRDSSLLPRLKAFPLVRRSDSDSTLLTYFEHIICSSATLVDNAHCNPYRYLILPMALQSEGLYHAALAIAANTLNLSDQRYRLPALEHHHQALNYLRVLLNQDTWLEREMDEMLGLVLMLCWFDISDGSRPSWVTHLDGFQNLIRKRKEHPGRSCHSQELTNFFNRYFAFHLVLARTAFRVTTSTPNTSRVLPGSILETSDIIDPYMGLSPALLLLIDQVAGLAWAREDNDKMSRKDVYQLKAKLDNLQQRQPTELLHSNTECGAIAEANRLGAVLLLYEICSTKSGSSKSNNSVIPSLNPEEKDVYIGKILGLILEKKANMMRTAVLPLWPLFLAGCCARGEEERVVVLQLFQEVESIRRFGNIAPAVEVVEMVWRQQDLSSQDERKRRKSSNQQKQSDRSQGTRLSWEHAMVVLGGWKLSLT